MFKLSIRERIVLAIDTSSEVDAERLALIAQSAGAKYVKFGLELASAMSWRYCSELAATHDLDWIADAKLDDIPNTVVRAIRNIKDLKHPPFGITVHATIGIEAMRAAQEEAGSIKIFGVTVLTSIKDEEAERLYHVSIRQKVLELADDVVEAGLQGIVCSPLEVDVIKGDPKTKRLLTLVPGVRSTSTNTLDQARVSTPSAAIAAGANLIVVGRQITEAEDPTKAYKLLIAEIEAGIRG